MPGYSPSINPDGVTNYTAEIQALLDFVGGTNGGGIVELPSGIIVVDSLVVGYQVHLKGQGPSTTLKNTNAASGNQAPIIRLKTAYGHQYLIGTSVSDLNLISDNAPGIKTDTATTTALTNLNLYNIQFTTGGIAVDLRGAYCQDCRFDNLRWVSGKDSFLYMYGNQNYLSKLSTEGSVAVGYSGTLPHPVYIQNSYNVSVRDCIFEGYNSAPPQVFVCFSGCYCVNVSNTWFEYSSNDSTEPCWSAKGSTINIDNLLNQNGNLPQLVDSVLNVTRFVATDFGFSGVTEYLENVDELSRINITHAVCALDAGQMDNPMVKIGSFYNQGDDTHIRIPPPIYGKNLVRNPDMALTSVATQMPTYWSTNLNSGGSAPSGSVSVEWNSDKTAKRVKFDVVANPGSGQLMVYIPVQSPVDNYKGLCEWRVDGVDTSVVWLKDFRAQFSSRQKNTLTYVVSPVPMLLDDQIVMQLYIQPSGTYYVSKVACHVMASGG